MTGGFQATSLRDLAARVSDPGAGPWQPQGRGTTGHRGTRPATPVQPLSAPCLNTVRDYPHTDLTITVGTALSLETLQATLAEKGQWLPGAWGSGSATVGGWLAADTRGPLCGGLGSARDSLLRVQWMNGEGQSLTAGAPVVKSVAGYDFMKLLIGSLGELGFLLEVTLKVIPRPDQWAVMRFAVDDAEDLLRIRAAAAALSPLAINLCRCGLDEDLHVKVTVAGPGARVEFQRTALTGMRRPVSVEQGSGAPDAPQSPAPVLAWGGVLPLGAWDTARAGAWADHVELDLLAGHLWMRAPHAPDPAALRATREAAAAFAGHLHLDCPTSPSWGRVEDAETELARRIKRALDPLGRWVSGRLPGGV